MENAVDALHIGFAMLVFAIAITLAFAVFSQARQVADIVFYYNDKTNFEEYVHGRENIDPNARHGERIVGLETIIPAIRRFVHENDGYWIEIIAGSKTYIFDINQLKEQGIITNTELQNYTTEKINEIIRNYGNNCYFVEKFSEYEYSGGSYKASNGETVEAVNTETKVKITYTKL